MIIAMQAPSRLAHANSGTMILVSSDCFIETLPTDLAIYLLSFFPLNCSKNIAAVSRKWRHYSRMAIIVYHYKLSEPINPKLQKLNHAVDLHDFLKGMGRKKARQFRILYWCAAEIVCFRKKKEMHFLDKATGMAKALEPFHHALVYYSIAIEALDKLAEEISKRIGAIQDPCVQKVTWMLLGIEMCQKNLPTLALLFMEKLGPHEANHFPTKINFNPLDELVCKIAKLTQIPCSMQSEVENICSIADIYLNLTQHDVLNLWEIPIERMGCSQYRKQFPYKNNLALTQTNGHH